MATNSPLIKVFSLSSWDVQFLRGHTDIVLALDVYKSGTLLASSSKVECGEACVESYDRKTIPNDQKVWSYHLYTNSLYLGTSYVPFSISV